jgi:uncharacterized lipoprotein YbaY
MRTGPLAMGRWAILAAVLSLAACSTPAPRVLVRPAAEDRGQIVAGSLLWPDAPSLPPGAHAEVTLLATSPAGQRLLSQSDAPAGKSPHAFGLWLQPGTLQPGQHYLLQARIVDAAGHVLWTLPAPLALDAAGTTLPLALSLQRPLTAVAGKPAPAAASSDLTEMFVAQGDRPSHWRAAILGDGAQRQLRAELDAKADARLYRGVTRKQLAHGALIFTANHGWVSLILTPGNCRQGAYRFPWHAMLEITGATFHGCARGMF